MGLSNISLGHILNVAGWACILIFFAIVEIAGKPAFLLLAPATLLCGLGLKFYNLAALAKAAEKTA
jgi:hypothetical protein